MASKGLSIRIGLSHFGILRTLQRNPNIFHTNYFWKKMQPYLMRADKILQGEIVKRITLSNAVAVGFMKKTVKVTHSFKDSQGDEVFKIVAGTDAWYDILVHEGLGRHSPVEGATIPEQYKPSATQKNILVPAWDSPERLFYYKKSPKKPRPFLRDGLAAALPQVGKMIGRGFANIFQEMSRG